MSRTLSSFLEVCRRRGPFWPFLAAGRLAALRIRGLPRGVCIEPSTLCTARCPGCTPSPGKTLSPDLIRAWLKCLPVPPATAHFTGRHSDPLASVLLKEQYRAAAESSLMVSISTIGVGLTDSHIGTPFDRWLVSIPAATPETYGLIRGSDTGFYKVINNTDLLRKNASGMVEVILTLWMPSKNDTPIFLELAGSRGWKHTQVVSGLFDPSGSGIGRIEMLPLSHDLCPYLLRDGEIELRYPPTGCSLAGYRFIDAEGVLRPCQFAGDDAPCWREPSGKAWIEAAAIDLDCRPFEYCRYCP